MHQLALPTLGGNLNVEVSAGNSLVFVGANGSGKSRLGAYIESHLPADAAHRIAAQRSIAMSDEVSLIEYETARNNLLFGNGQHIQNKSAYRWGNKPEVHAINDFGVLLQALFAEQARVAVHDLLKRHRGTAAEPPVTLIIRLKRVWERLLPHRKLAFSNAAVRVALPDTSESDNDEELLALSYGSSEMSDGERVIFYLIGQCLMAPAGSVLIIDEPELHIHKAISASLWDALEAERADCAFVYFTHDLEFAESRLGAKKYVVSAYNNRPPVWGVSELPADDVIPERVLTELIGSRRSVIFAEGDGNGLDAAIYRHIYPEFKIHSVGSCEDVIHSAASFRKHAALHRHDTVFGYVDNDGRDQSDVDYLSKRGIYVLPVSEIENILLLPNVFKEIAIALGFSEGGLNERVQRLAEKLVSSADQDIEGAALRYTRRQIDAAMKRIGLSGKDPQALSEELNAAVSSLNPEALYNGYRNRLAAAIAAKDLTEILKLYDSKGISGIAAGVLELKSRDAFHEFFGRLIAGDRGEPLKRAISDVLPLKLATAANGTDA